MEEIQSVMKGIFEKLRENLFTIVGDPPYTPEIETLDINHAYFPKEEWSKFKELDQEFFDIISEISEEYENVFNGTKAAILKKEIKKDLGSFIAELDDFYYYLESYNGKIWDKFYEIENGDTDVALEIVLSDLHEEKDRKFSHLSYRGEELLKNFDEIEPKVESVLDLIEEIKYEMIKNTVYENQSLVEE